MITCDMRKNVTHSLYEVLSTQTSSLQRSVRLMGCFKMNNAIQTLAECKKVVLIINHYDL